MEVLNKNKNGMSANQLANGTPSDRLIELKSFYKGDKCTISPAKDFNGRYLGINENISDIKKSEMGYVATPESKVKLYDDMKIDLNDSTWAKDWEWMVHCAEIAEDFSAGQAARGAYFYIYRPGIESAKKVSEREAKVELMNYILRDSNENLYNRANILGVDMSDCLISEVKEFLLDMVDTAPGRVRKVYESKTFSLELLLIHSIKKNIIKKRGGVYTFGEILLGVEESAVVAFFANPKNASTTTAIESLTYASKDKVKNPLENEVVQGEEYDIDSHALVGGDSDEGIKTSAMEEDLTGKTVKLTPQQKAAKTRAANIAKNKK